MSSSAPQPQGQAKLAEEKERGRVPVAAAAAAKPASKPAPQVFEQQPGDDQTWEDLESQDG